MTKRGACWALVFCVGIAACRGGTSKRADDEHAASPQTVARSVGASDAAAHAAIDGGGAGDAARDASPDGQIAGPVIVLHDQAKEATLIGRYLYYYNSDDRLRRVSIDGGDVEVVMPELGRIGTIAGATDGSIVVSAKRDNHWRIVRLRDGKAEDVAEDDRNWVGSIVATQDTVWWHANDPSRGDHIRGVGPSLDATSPITNDPSGGTGAGTRSNLVLDDSYVYWIANQRLWRWARAADTPAEEVLTVSGYRLVRSRTTLFAAAADGVIKIDTASGKTAYLDHAVLSGLAANAAWVAYVSDRWAPGRPEGTPLLEGMTAEIHLLRRRTGTAQVVLTQESTDLGVLMDDRYLYVQSQSEVKRLELPAQ